MTTSITKQNNNYHSLFRYQGKVLSAPLRCYIRPLSEKDCPQMARLSQTIYQHLHAGEECFIHRHNADYYQNIFQEDNTQYIGVFLGEKLIAMSYLKICDDKAVLQEELPNASYDFFNPCRNAGKNKIASCGGDSVLPDFRGNHLNYLMIQYRVSLAKALKCTDCTAIVDRKNRWNLPPYFAAGFCLFQSAIDPCDNGKISLLHKNLTPQNMVSEHLQTKQCNYDDFAAIDGVLTQGYVGTSFDTKTGKITFVPSDDYRENKLSVIFVYQRQRAFQTPR